MILAWRDMWGLREMDVSVGDHSEDILCQAGSAKVETAVHDLDVPMFKSILHNLLILFNLLPQPNTCHQ